MLVEIPRFNIENVDDNDSTDVACNYYSPESVRGVIAQCRSPFSLLSVNIRSCRKNFSSLLSLLNVYMLNFTLLILVETWLTEGIDFGFDISEYNQLNIYRNGNGGGIKVFFRDALNVQVLDELTIVNNIAEILTFYLLGVNFRYLICCVYRSPSYNPRDFNDFFFDEIVSKFPRNVDVIVTGDFNLNLFNPTKARYITDFTDNFLSFNYFPIINIPAVFNENNSITK